MKIDSLERKITLAILLGIITGFIVAITKFGWEVPFPPRTPIRDLINPPQQILQQLGFSFEFTHLTYFFSGNPRPIISFVVHIGFSIFFALLYCIVSEFWSTIKKWQGVLYGLAIWFLFHIILMPWWGTIPAPWDQPFDEHFSEITGHMFCFWLMELTRRDLRNRITHQPDPN